MSHPLYENLIFGMDQLSDAQRSALNQHLEDCAACRQLWQRWTSVQGELHGPVLAVPRAGFTRRWQAGFSERRLREQRQQAWKLFLACAGAAALALTALVAYLVYSTTPVEWVQAGVSAISAVVGVLSTLRDVTYTWFQIVPPLLSVTVGVTLAGMLCLLTVFWGMALWRTTQGKGVL